MNNLQIFKNEEFGEIRVVEKEGQPWFVAKDVCDILEIQNTTDATKRLDADEVTRFNLGGLTGETNLVNEYGLYSLILGSRKPEAKKFKRWVTHEVLPSIRKNGGYIANQENLTPEQIVAQALIVANNIIQEKDRLLAEQKPKVLFAEAVGNSDDVILVKEMAHIISQRGFEIGQNQLFQFLRDNGYLCKKEGDMYHLPTKRYQHFFKVTKRIIQNPTGTKVKNTPKITGKGQMYFMEKFDEFLEQGLTIKDLLKEER